MTPIGQTRAQSFESAFDLAKRDQLPQVKKPEMRRIPDFDHTGFGQLVNDPADRLDCRSKEIGNVLPWQLQGQDAGAVGQVLIGQELGGHGQKGAKAFIRRKRANQR